jgi:hypothetical protein|tara:strand:- start:830 stop:1510 length:681 start_codon:yes stop_codon:yes gene_type:complete
MSIVAMKRKSRVANKAISGYGEGFSLNGGRRSQGWVGQSSLGRGLNGTRFRGPNPMAVGKLGSNSVVNSGRCSANDPSIIKRSTMNNAGHVSANLRNPTSVFNEHCTAANSHDWVQVFNEYDRSQGGHVNNVRTQVTAGAGCDDGGEDAGTCDDKCKKTGVLAVGEAATGAVSSSDYMRGGLLARECLPTPKNMVHWPQWINHNGGCNVNYTTPGGGFPAEWNWGA